mmetsp:Transcript_3151/g.3559  ORF Transcript_3151/g.3559 Transcript_3151/m.3559 type:complete len:158 (+) Transcript_3151:63-536(+)|eukprot:CAMPEP_0170798490 /NCGR_PEP_ID=MMETSP0733-20121128/26380_1 /TAXON_ID=186038 /ORGANISM="Fragilariopsis kerguelensis, Strain L26-C5" /LENGTH=157 /DNA_ID=CAMNT_0011149839 /DNA_START=61 /DNA_END=534 /DNA_ORIENTATION=+
MAEEQSTPDVQRFDHKEYDVTCCFETLFCGTAHLILGEEDAELNKSCLGGICKSKKRGPYGELGTIDSSNCCCFVGFAANSLMEDPNAYKHIGCGCDGDEIDEIVTELKKRQALRGDRAKTRMAESTVASLKLLHQKVDAVMNKLDMPLLSAEEMER